MQKFILFFIFIFIHCKTDTNNKNNKSQAQINCIIYPNTEGLRLSATPGENGKEIQTLDVDEPLIDLNECSNFNSRIKIDGNWYDEPWIKVKTYKKVEGWVYAGAVRFIGDTPSASTMALLEKRTKSTFGIENFNKIINYRIKYQEAVTDQELQQVLMEGDQLRLELEKILLKKATVSEETGYILNYNWLDVLLPGYQATLAVATTEYNIFKDYRQLIVKAKSTTGDADNQYVKYSIEYYPDSIEYICGKYNMLLPNFKTTSLLGDGKHFELLKKANELNKLKYFHQEIIGFKNHIIDDITGMNGITYWNSKDKILEEINKIISSSFEILSKEDQIALETRRDQFKNAAENKIILNLRTGE